MITSMRGAYPMVYATLDENLIQNNVADGRFTFANPIMEDNVSAILNDSALMQAGNLDRVDGRFIFSSDLIYEGEKFPVIVIGVNFPNEVNQLVVEQRSSDIISNDLVLDNSSNCLLETRFAGSLIGQNVPLDSNLSISFGSTSQNFTVKGIASDVDYSYMVDPISNMALMGQMAVVWIDLGSIQNLLFGGAPLINQILFTIDVDNRLNNSMILKTADTLSLNLVEHNVDFNNIQFTIYDETLNREFFDSDAGSIDKVGIIFGIIGIIVCSVMIFNTLNRIVETQRKNIGLFMSMGSKPKKIINHYIKITMSLVSIGVLIGIPLGYLSAMGMAKLLLKVYAFHFYSFPVAYVEYIGATIAVFLVSFILSIVSAYPITRITPREAMTAAFNRIKVTKKNASEKLFGWIPIFYNIHMRVPLREIFFRKKRSVFTILAITTSMIILINSAAMVYNMEHSITDNYDKYNKADVQILLKTPIPESEVNHFMHNISLNQNITHHEIFLNLYTKISKENEFLTWSELECYQSNSTLRNFNVIEGVGSDKSDLTNETLLLGNAIAGKYDLMIGDDIKIGLMENYSVEIGGLVGELLDYNALWTLEAFYNGNISSSFGVPNGYINGILINVAPDADLNMLRETFEEYFQISQWMDNQSAKQSVMNMMESMMGILFIFLLFGILVGMMFSFSSMYLAFVDRESDFIALKAMGTKPKYIKRMIFWENSFLSIFSLILTVPLGYLTYRWSMNYMIGDKFYIPLTIPGFIWPIIFLLSMISIWLATGRLMKKIKKMELVDELRKYFIS
ncbi:MAG: ABC transporter permease, partial [Promethearchaeota archaeon]